MQSIINNWLDLARSYGESRSKADRMARIEPPAEDFASKLHAADANRSGQAYQTYIAHNERYCLHQAELFQAALDDYLGVEDTNVTEIGDAGQQSPQAGV